MPDHITPRRYSSARLLPLCLLVMPAVSQLSAQVTVITTETQVNTTTAGVQYQPAIAMDAAGNTIAAWASYGQDGSGYGVYAQRRSADGMAAGSEFALNTTAQYDQRHVRVVSEASGRFAAVWQGDRQGGRDGWEIILRYFAADGTARTSEIAANANSVGHQRRPAIATDALGLTYAVVWEGAAGIVLRLFDADGVPTSAEVTAHSSTFLRQAAPDVAIAGDGTITVVWQSADQGASKGNIYARRFDKDGLALGAEFVVAQSATAAMSSPRVAVAADGNSVVTWQQQEPGNLAVGYLTAYDTDASPLGSTQALSTASPAFPQTNPAIGITSGHLITAAWSSRGRDGDLDGVYVRVFDAGSAGTPVALAAESLANQTTVGFQQAAAVAASQGAKAAIVWQDGYRSSADGTGADGSTYGIFGAIYEAARPALPVELLSFSAVKEGTSALVSWQSASEVGVSHYDVEHSTNGVDYTVFDVLAAKGRPTSTERYHTLHSAPQRGANYYRLHIVDSDGTDKYSQVRVVTFDGSLNSYRVFPNPTTDLITVAAVSAGSSKTTRVRLMDPLGRTLRDEYFSESTQLDLRELVGGSYIVTVQSGSELSTFRVLKQ